MDIKKTIFKIGMLSLIIGYFGVVYTFFGAYFHKDKYIIVAIDLFNEADFEALMLFISLPCVVYFLMENRKAISKMELYQKNLDDDKMSANVERDDTVYREMRKSAELEGEIQDIWKAIENIEGDIKFLATAILEQEKTGRLSPDLVDELIEMSKD